VERRGKIKRKREKETATKGDAKNVEGPKVIRRVKKTQEKRGEIRRRRTRSRQVN